MELIAPSDMPTLKPSKTLVGGGGGGGDRDKLQASQGRLPRQAMEQFTPPVVVVRNEHPKLPMEPTLVIPPDVHIQQPNMPNLGDPLSHLPSGPPSNGTGYGGGIGTGNGGGVGSGEGPGFGPGRGGGTGGGVFRVGGGVSAPKAIYCPRSGIFRGSPEGKISGDVRPVAGRGSGWQAKGHPSVPNAGPGAGRESD